MPHSLNIEGNAPMRANVDYAKHRDTMRYDIPEITDLEQLRKQMHAVLGAMRGQFSLSPERRYVTFGSCFATNLAEALRARGARVYTTCVTEDVNSTHNNRYLLERVFELKNTPFTDELVQVTGVNYIELLDRFKGATDIILTLGNVFHIENDAGHTLLSKNGTRLVRETYEQTVASLQVILALLQTHTRARLYVSVSPIPISGYRGIEFQSALEADCASKCQLMTALRSMRGYDYVPTFEIFRWLSAHQGFPTFGVGTGHPRHLSAEHVSIAMGLLCSD